MIEMSGIGVRIGSATLLADVDFDAPMGKLTAILGPNGAGKSTLLKVAAGTVVPSRGSVRFGGRPLAGWPRRELARRRAILSQRTDLTFALTALDVVLLGRSPYAGQTRRTEDVRIALAAMETCGVDRLAGRTWPTLSGGEQQRVGLARVLAQLRRPGDAAVAAPGDTETGAAPAAAPADGVPAPDACLLLDEPTSSLDIAHQQAILALAHRLAADGMAVIAVLHDVNLAAAFADRVFLMKHGRVVAAGPAAETLRPEVVGPVFDIGMRVVADPEGGSGYLVPATGGQARSPATGGQAR